LYPDALLHSFASDNLKGNPKLASPQDEYVAISPDNVQLSEVFSRQVIAFTKFLPLTVMSCASASSKTKEERNK